MPDITRVGRFTCEAIGKIRHGPFGNSPKSGTILALKPTSEQSVPHLSVIEWRSPHLRCNRVAPPRNPRKIPTRLMKPNALHKPRRHFTKFLDSRLHI